MYVINHCGFSNALFNHYYGCEPFASIPQSDNTGFKADYVPHPIYKGCLIGTLSPAEKAFDVGWILTSTDRDFGRSVYFLHADYTSYHWMAVFLPSTVYQTDQIGGEPRPIGSSTVFGSNYAAPFCVQLYVQCSHCGNPIIVRKMERIFTGGEASVQYDFNGVFVVPPQPFIKCGCCGNGNFGNRIEREAKFRMFPETAFPLMGGWQLPSHRMPAPLSAVAHGVLPSGHHKNAQQIQDPFILPHFFNVSPSNLNPSGVAWRQAQWNWYAGF
jgi:hypothetical protein